MLSIRSCLLCPASILLNTSMVLLQGGQSSAWSCHASRILVAALCCHLSHVAVLSDKADVAKMRQEALVDLDPSMALGHHQAHRTGPSGLTHCISVSSTAWCRKVKRRQEAPRWVDSYTVPGQYVGVRYPRDPISDSLDSSSGATEGAPAPHQQHPTHRLSSGLYRSWSTCRLLCREWRQHISSRCA